MEFTRRSLLKASAALPAMRLGGLLPLAGEPTAAQPSAASTSDRIHFNQTLIAEAYNPPFYPSLDYDPSRAVKIAVELGCDSFRYPAASYLAYFPTTSGFPVHPELKGDPMRTTIDLLKQSGLLAIAYVPLNHPFMAIDAGDPRYADWTRRRADGSPMITTHYGFNQYFEGCLNSPVRKVVRQLVADVLRYEFDVMYFDGPYQGMLCAKEFCHCRYCEEAYRARFDVAVPDQDAASIEERARYISWMRDEVVGGFFQEICDLVRSTRNVPVLFNDTGLLTKTEWRARCIPSADGFMFEAAECPEDKLFNLLLGRSTGKIIWTYIGHHTEYNREHIKQTAIRGWFSYPVEEQELSLDGAVSTAAGAGSVYWGLPRFFYQQQSPLSFESGREVRDMFDFRREHLSLLKTLKPHPQAGILVSDQTINWHAGKTFVASAYSNYYHGAFNLLKSLSVDAEPFLDWMMSKDVLSRYSLLYLPDAICLSDAQCAMVRDYVADGGTLVATHLTSTEDELGRRRKDFGLADVLGASLAAAEPFEYPDLYLHFPDGREFPQDPQITRFKAAGGQVLANTYDRGNRRTLGPAVLQNTFGKGKVIYIGSGLEAIYEETRMSPVRECMSSLLMPLLSAGQRYVVEYRPGLTPQYMASEKTIVLHLLTNVGDRSLHLKSRGSLTPLENVKVRIRVPSGVRSVGLMRSRAAIRHERAGEWLSVTVPRVVGYEAIRVDLL